MSNPASPRLTGNETKYTDLPDTTSLTRTDSVSSDSARSKLQQELNNNCGAGDVAASQTRKDTECNTSEPNSLTTETESSSTNNRHDCVDVHRDKMDKANKAMNSRNPITGMGLNGDGVGGLKPLKPKTRRDGNPVTGEGYNKAIDVNHTPSLNGANQIINKNRIPPGGYSSGLW